MANRAQLTLDGIPSDAEMGPLFTQPEPKQLGLIHELRQGPKHRPTWLDFHADDPCNCVLCAGLTDEQRAWESAE